MSADKVHASLLLNPASPQIRAHGVADVDVAAGLRFLGVSEYKSVEVKGDNYGDRAVTDQIAVPAGTKVAVLICNYANVQLRTSANSEGLSESFVMFYPQDLSGTVLKFMLGAVVRNGNAQNDWRVIATVSAMCSG